METPIAANCAAMDGTGRLTAAAVWRDILAQSMTGELLAAMNYGSLAGISDAAEQAAEALAHARQEREHAAAFAAEGRRLGIQVVSNVGAKHWQRLRDAFMRCIAERDIIGCLIVQELMLESFAVASYVRVARVATGSLGKTFARIAAEEQQHAAHALAMLRALRALDPQRFDAKLHRLHLEVMTILAQMLARDCRQGHCEVCHGGCVKPSLSEVSLSASELRGASLQQYLNVLDALEIPGEVTLAWMTQLPV